MGQPLLILPLHHRPLLLECCIVGMLKKTLDLEEVFEPDFLGDTESLCDELRETGIALVEPATRGDPVCDVAKPISCIGHVHLVHFLSLEIEDECICEDRKRTCSGHRTRQSQGRSSIARADCAAPQHH